MNPYQVLGVERGATRDEIKRAYRREAMKWHPDRNGGSVEARERFDRVTEAYRRLTAAHGGARRGAHAAGERSRPGGTGAGRGPGGRGRRPDSAYWDELLDHAIRLAQSGHDQGSIAVDLVLRGCPDELAAKIADKALAIHARYGADNRGAGPGESSAGSRHGDYAAGLQENDLLRAFLGERNLLLSRRETVEYYLVVFNRLRQRAGLNPLRWISPNRRLLRLFAFSLLLFAAIATALHFFPGPSQYKLMPDLAMLQVPFALLALSFVWMVYRKLWGLTLVILPAYLATLAYYNEAMPAAYASGPAALIGVAAVCFAPFALATLFANYAYYHKAMKLVGEAGQLFESPDERLTWIRYRAGTSTGAALLFAIAFAATMHYLVPRGGTLSSLPSFNLFSAIPVEDAARTREIRARMDDAENLFDIGERHYHAERPDFMRAEMAYTSAAGDGSLLAAYKLGYMYHHGRGVDRNPRLARYYFEQATLAPLAFQPHSLELTTRFLAEAFNNLGLIYHAGRGRTADRGKALEMFRRGAEFGSERARRNLERVRRGAPPVDTTMAIPDYGA